MTCMLLLGDSVEWLGVFGTMISIIVTVVIGFSVLTSYVQFKQGQEYLAQARSEAEKAAAAFKSSGLKPPDEIVREVESLYDPRIEQLRAGLERMQTDTRRELEEIRQLVVQSASMDAVLREVERKFRDPKDLEETILRKVLDAFLRVKNLQ